MNNSSMLSQIKAQWHGKMPECIILALMLILLSINLSEFIDVNVWRHDSMYYIDGYRGKLDEEGRWINYLFFQILRIIPSDIAIFFSYASVIVFAYSVGHRITDNFHYSAAYSLLCSLIPLLAVQLEWPETTLIAFGLLALSPIFQRSLPRYIFFPLTATLFFGTFSSFYFLMPLLFLKDLNRFKFLEILAYWAGSFVLAYVLTNFIVYAWSGHAIQLASWRNPNYVVDMSTLQENLNRLSITVRHHVGKLQAVMSKGGVVAFMLLAASICFVKKQGPGTFMALIASTAIYVSTVPVGIYVSDRTALVSYVALFAALFLFQFRTRLGLVAGMSAMLLVSFAMAKASNDSVRWYKTNTQILTRQLSAAIPYRPEEVRRLFIISESSEVNKLMKTVEESVGIRNLFSEGFGVSYRWIPALKVMGFKNSVFRDCPDLLGRDCELVLPYYKDRLNYQQATGLFISLRLPNGDLLLMINPKAL